MGNFVQKLVGTKLVSNPPKMTLAKTIKDGGIQGRESKGKTTLNLRFLLYLK